MWMSSTSDGIPASAVRCLRGLPNGKVDITFGSQEMRDQFFQKIGLYCESAAICGPSCSEAFDLCNYFGCSI